MAVDGVNGTSNNNAGLYALGAGTMGATAGVATAYLTKPFLEDGAPTDSFIKKVVENSKEHAGKLEKEIDNIKNVDELKNFVENNEVIKLLNGGIDDVLKEVETNGLDSVKTSFKEDVKNCFEDTKPEEWKKRFGKYWDKNANKFVDDTAKVPKEMLDMYKKAAKSIQGKYAMIYGAIGAGVLGLGTLLCCGGKKEPEQPQNT